MTTAGQFPKITGDIYNAADANVDTASYDASIESTMSVTTTTGTIDLSSLTHLSDLTIENVGSNTAYFRFATTAVVTDFPIRSGETLNFRNTLVTRIDAITNSGTAELKILAKENSDYDGYQASDELLTLTATAASSNASFSDTTKFKDILVANTGFNEVYLVFGATAVVTDIKILPGTTMYLGHTDQYQIAGICNTTEATTVKILGIY